MALPLAVYAWQNPDAFNQRVRDVAVVEAAEPVVVQAGTVGERLLILLRFFTVEGDTHGMWSVGRLPGLNILLLDARNHGRSDSASFSSLPRFAEDAGTVVDWVKAHGSDPYKRVALLGHSVGAGAVLFEASRRDDIAAVISIAAFAHPEWLMRRYLARFRLPGFCTSWILRYVEWVIGHRYTDIAPMNTACRVQCPILLVHGTADETVPLTDARAIQNHCSGKKPELLLIEGGTHDSVEQVEHHADKLVAFLQKTGII